MAGMDANLVVGNGRSGVTDGTDQTLRGGRTGELVVGQAHDDLNEAMIRGNMFTGSTGVAGVAPGTALSTTPPLVLYNPPSSGYIAILSEAEIAFLSGTLGAGNVVLAGIGGQNISTANLGTNLNPTTTLIGGGTSPQCKLLQAPTLSAAPTLIRNLWYTGAFVTNATAYMVDARKILRGTIGVAPGGALCIQEVGGAGSTPLVLLSMTWEEVPLVFNK